VVEGSIRRGDCFFDVVWMYCELRLFGKIVLSDGFVRFWEGLT
jgi:hypothetical protein